MTLKNVTGDHKECHSVQAKRDDEPAPCLTRGNPDYKK